MDKNRQHYKMTLLEWCKINNVGLIDEWDKTNEVTMDEIGSSSGIKVKWICSRCGFHFEQRPSDRTRGHGCPKCARKSHSSVPETICYLAVKKYYPDAIHGYKAEWLGRREIDIFIPSLNIGIEYDGNSWHNKSRLQMDNDKMSLCAEHNISIYRIREIGCEPMNDNSLAEFYPEIAKEWDYNKNERTPDNVARMAGLEAWWICLNGHSWKASVHSRTHDGKKCPYCKQTQTINC